MTTEHPLPGFHFQVEWGGAKLNFTEVTGMDHQVEVIEDRHSGSKGFSTIKMPGMRKCSNITLKRGLFEGDFDVADWLAEISNECATARRDFVIRLMNEMHETVAAWKAANCFLVKVQAPDFNSDANEVAIETM